MKRLTGLMGIWALALSSVVALAQLTSTGAGKKAAGAAAYSGPGDVVSGASAWYGLRAYSAADRGNRLLNICNVSDVACADLSSDATTGALVISAIGGSSCSIVTCTIKTMYDRSGNGKDITQATIVNRPTLTVSCLGALPCSVFLASNAQRLDSSGNVSLSQPFSIYAVAKRTTPSPQNVLISNGNNTTHVGYDSTDQAYIYGGTSQPIATATDNAFHVIQNLFNGASSNILVDATSNTVSPGTTGFTSSIVTIGRRSVGLLNFNGSLTEIGLWNSNIISSSLCNNAYTYWGTSVSC